MKAKMKKLISIKSVPVLVLALLIVLGTALAESEGDSVTGSGDVLLTRPNGGEGTATLSIEGEKLDAEVIVNILSGDMPLEVEHKFSFGEGSFTTIGNEVLKPTDEDGLFVLTGDMTIDSGEGTFAGASGEMSVHGQIHLVEGWASFRVNGTISR
ncbi:MAG: hypothetical protein ACYSWO_00380 [Planctomycetota bacterium]|jgi:hypothetical protein